MDIPHRHVCGETVDCCSLKGNVDTTPQVPASLCFSKAVANSPTAAAQPAGNEAHQFPCHPPLPVQYAVSSNDKIGRLNIATVGFTGDEDGGLSPQENDELVTITSKHTSDLGGELTSGDENPLLIEDCNQPWSASGQEFSFASEEPASERHTSKSKTLITATPCDKVGGGTSEGITSK